MSNLVKMQAEQSKNEFTSCAHTIGKGLGASLLCLSVLAGCASNPDQEQSIVSADNTAQTEVAAPESNSQAEQVDTKTQTSTENGSQEVTTETASTAPEAEPDTTTNTTTDRTPPNTATATSATVEEDLAPEAKPSAATLNSEPSAPIADTSATAGALVVGEEEAVIEETTNREAAADQPLTRSSKNVGKSYGIWTLKGADNGFCKLKTPTLQIGNKEYSSQIWMDIEEQQIIVNAYMALDIKHPKTGIQIDNQALIPFAEKVNSTRAVVSGDMTAQLSSGKELHIFINGKEVGKQVLKRNVKLTDMNAAISALRSCRN